MAVTVRVWCSSGRLGHPISSSDHDGARGFGPVPLSASGQSRPNKNTRFATLSPHSPPQSNNDDMSVTSFHSKTPAPARTTSCNPQA